MIPVQVAKMLSDNCDDDAIIINILDNHFDKLSDKDKAEVVVILLGNLSRSREIAGYGAKVTGVK